MVNKGFKFCLKLITIHWISQVSYLVNSTSVFPGFISRDKSRFSVTGFAGLSNSRQFQFLLFHQFMANPGFAGASNLVKFQVSKSSQFWFWNPAKFLKCSFCPFRLRRLQLSCLCLLCMRNGGVIFVSYSVYTQRPLLYSSELTKTNVPRKKENCLSLLRSINRRYEFDTWTE